MTTTPTTGSPEWLRARADSAEHQARIASRGRSYELETAAGLRAAADEIERLRETRDAACRHHSRSVSELEKAVTRIAELEANTADLQRENLALAQAIETRDKRTAELATQLEDSLTDRAGIKDDRDAGTNT